MNKQTIHYIGALRWRTQLGDVATVDGAASCAGSHLKRRRGSGTRDRAAVTCKRCRANLAKAGQLKD